MLHDTPRFDKFGFYQVSNFRTYSKFEAVEYATRINGKVHWNFNDSAFSAFDWTIPPAVSIKDLYYARARQIRDKYDHVTICFSGGSDSTNVLQSFLQAGVKIDEILVVTVESTKEKTGIISGEIFQVAIPYAKQVVEQNPDIKLTVVDMSGIYFVAPKIVDLVYQRNWLTIPAGTSISLIREVNEDWKRLSDLGKKSCFVWGQQKPMMTTHYNRLCYSIPDYIDFTVSPSAQQDGVEWQHDELFYASPDCVPLMIKQCHIIKDFLQSDGVHNPIFDRFFQTTESMFGSTIRNNRTEFLKITAVNELVYPLEHWNPDTWSRGKAASTVKPDYDKWFYEGGYEEVALYTKAQDYIAGVAKTSEWGDCDAGGWKLKRMMSTPMPIE